MFLPRVCLCQAFSTAIETRSNVVIRLIRFVNLRCCWLFFVTEKTEFETAVRLHIFISLWHICNYYWLYCLFVYCLLVGYAGCFSLDPNVDRLSVGNMQRNVWWMITTVRSFAVQRAEWNATSQPTNTSQPILFLSQNRQNLYLYATHKMCLAHSTERAWYLNIF